MNLLSNQNYFVDFTSKIFLGVLVSGKWALWEVFIPGKQLQK